MAQIAARSAATASRYGVICERVKAEVPRTAKEFRARIAAASRGAAPPLSGRLAGAALECTAERGFGLVTHSVRHRSDLGSRLGEHARGELHAPLRQVLRRRLPDEMRKALCQ